MINSWKDIPADKMQAMLSIGKQYPDRGDEFDAAIARVLGITAAEVPATMERLRATFSQDMTEALAPFGAWVQDVAAGITESMARFAEALPPWIREGLAAKYS